MREQRKPGYRAAPERRHQQITDDRFSARQNDGGTPQCVARRWYDPSLNAVGKQAGLPVQHDIHFNAGRAREHRDEWTGKMPEECCRAARGVPSRFHEGCGSRMRCDLDPPRIFLLHRGKASGVIRVAVRREYKRQIAKEIQLNEASDQPLAVTDESGIYEDRSALADHVH